MKALKTALFLLFSIHPLANSADATSSEIANSAVFWTIAPSIVSRVNVREAANRNSPIIDKVRRGTLFTVKPSKSKNNFFYVSYNDSISQGFIASSLLTPINSTQKSNINPESLNHLTKLLKSE